MRAYLTFALFAVFGVDSASATESKDKPYPFAQEPLQVFDRLIELKLGTPAPISGDERRLLIDAWKRKSSGKSDRPSEAEILDAMLYASGVEKSEDLRNRREQFESIAAAAKEAVKGVDDKKARGEKLMRHLHETVLKKGYVERQSSLVEAFDSNTYNCVSSTAMYYLVGTHLGLDLRPISISGGYYLPGHAALDMMDGAERIQVEPTNPDGFDWKTKVSRPGVIVYGYVPDRKNGREVDAFGIAAMIYQNRAVSQSKATPPRSLDAVRNALCALALDPNDEGMANNLTAVFVNWSPALAKEKKFEDAVRVVHFGLSFAPKLHDLRNNACWVWWQFFRAAMEDGKDADAAKIAERGVKALPNESGFRDAGELFTRYGDEVYEKSGHDACLKIAERSLKVLSRKVDVQRVLDWRGHTYLLWSQGLLEKNDVPGSLKVVTQAFEIAPDAKATKEAVEYHAYCVLSLKETDLAAATTRFRLLRTRFPKVEKVVQIARDRAMQEVDRLTEQAKFVEAIDFARRAKVMLEKPKDQAEVLAGAYDDWGRSLAKAEKWQEAIDKYKEGLKELPRQDRLVTNGLATIHEWAQPYIKAEKWDDAARIFKIGFDIRPNDGILASNIKVCNERKKK